MSPRMMQKLILGAVLGVLIIAAVIFINTYDNKSAALPLYLGIAAIAALFLRLIIAPQSRR